MVEIIGHGEVEISIVIEIARHGGNRQASCREVILGRESAVSLAQQDRNRIRPLIDHRHIRPTVPVKVRHDGRLGTYAGREISSPEYIALSRGGGTEHLAQNEAQQKGKEKTVHEFLYVAVHQVPPAEINSLGPPVRLTAFFGINTSRNLLF